MCDLTHMVGEGTVATLLVTATKYPPKTNAGSVGRPFEDGASELRYRLRKNELEEFKLK